MVTIADLNPENAKAACRSVGWTEELIDKTLFTDDAISMLAGNGIDVLAGPLLAEEARSAGVVYSMAYGDQPALTCELAADAGMIPQMFNSFLDGTKTGLEMAAIANATGLAPPPDGLAFHAAGMDDLAHVLRPVPEGGQLSAKGQVEVVSSIEHDGRPVFKDLRWGVYVVFEAPTITQPPVFVSTA